MTDQPRNERFRSSLQEIADDCHIGMSLHGHNALTGGPVDRLPPRLWERFRLELQRKYRVATGEEFAVIKVEEGT